MHIPCYRVLQIWLNYLVHLRIEYCIMQKVPHSRFCEGYQKQGIICIAGNGCNLRLFQGIIDIVFIQHLECKEKGADFRLYERFDDDIHIGITVTIRLFAGEHQQNQNMMNRGFCLRKHEINYQISENDIVAVVHGICEIQICGGDDHTH